VSSASSACLYQEKNGICNEGRISRGFEDGRRNKFVNYSQRLSQKEEVGRSRGGSRNVAATESDFFSVDVIVLTDNRGNLSPLLGVGGFNHFNRLIIHINGEFSVFKKIQT